MTERSQRGTNGVAAVAAVSSTIAAEALDLIEVEYEVLPHVIDVEEAMAPAAPVLHDDLFNDWGRAEAG
jgi:CO/xanthine dehydrogenase Mo-binding subunit